MTLLASTLQLFFTERMANADFRAEGWVVHR